MQTIKLKADTEVTTRGWRDGKEWQQVKTLPQGTEVRCERTVADNVVTYTIIYYDRLGARYTASRTLTARTPHYLAKRRALLDALRQGRDTAPTDQQAEFDRLIAEAQADLETSTPATEVIESSEHDGQRFQVCWQQTGRDLLWSVSPIGGNPDHGTPIPANAVPHAVRTALLIRLGLC